MENKHILLTSDLSEEAQRAFAPVGNLARWLEAKVTLLHVLQVVKQVPPGTLLGQPLALGDPERERKQALAALEEQSALLGKDVEVELEVIAGENVQREIARYAEEHGVGLVAMSSHGRTGLRRMVLGSVAEAVLRHSRVPVLVFPPPK